MFKSIGKVFKKVVKVALKIAPYALAAAAVVFTGGAALGILPTFSAAVGGLVSSLGLSAAVTGALTGAVTSAGFGAAIGFVTGGKKGMQKGALMGALTGGVLGAASPATFGIVKDATGAVTTSHALASQAGNLASKGIAPVSSDLLNPQPLSHIGSTPSLSSVADSLPGLDSSGISSAAATAQASQGIAPLASKAVASAAPQLADPSQFMSSAVTPQAAMDSIHSLQSTTGGVGGIPASGGSGVLDLLNKNPSLVGSLLTALGTSNSKVSSKDLQKQVDAQVQLKQREDALAYGGAYAGKADPFGIGNTSYAIPQPRYYYDANSKQVVDRQQQGG